MSSGAAPASLAAAGPAIQHQPLRCVVAHTHPWLQARVTDAVAVLARFRLVDSRDWYTVRLTEDEDGWVGALPQPRASLNAFAYYLEATDAATETARTAEHKVRVVAAESACGTEGVGPSVPEATVTTEAPRGQPPLPKGFASAEEEESGGGKVGAFGFSPRTSLLAGLGLTAAAVGVGVAVSNGSDSPSQVELVDSSPPPGSTISLASLALSVRVRVKSSRDIGPGSVALSLRPAGGSNCISLWSAHAGITADRAAEVSLSRVLFVECAAPFTTQEAYVAVRGPGETDVFEDAMPLSYSFVP